MDAASPSSPIPLRDTDETLHRLLVVEALVIAGVLLVLGARRVGRRARRPAAARPHGPHRGRDRRRRPLAPRRVDRPAHRGRPPRASRSTRCSTASSGRSASARPARTACAASSPTPRTSCARRWPRSAATPSCSAWAPRASPADVEKAMRRIEDEAARMGVLVEDLLTLARLDEVRRRAARRARPRRARRATPSTTRAPPRPGREIDVAGRRRRRRSSATATSCARCSATCCATRSSTRPTGTPIEVTPRARGRRRAPRGARPRPGPADRATPSALFERFWRSEGGRERGRGGAGPRPGDRRRRSSTRTAARCAPATRPAAAPRSSSRLPAPPERRLPGALSAASHRGPTSRADAVAMTEQTLSRPRPARARPVPARARRASRSSCPSTTSRPRSSAASAGCTAS